MVENTVRSFSSKNLTLPEISTSELSDMWINNSIFIRKDDLLSVLDI